MTALIVIPCSGAKLDTGRPKAAGLIYAGSLHTAAQRASAVLAHRIEATGMPTRRSILSAKHGLLDFGQRILPYDLTIGDPGAVDVAAVADQLRTIGARWVVSLCPNGYTELLAAACELAGTPLDRPLAGCGGIGEQRGRLASIRRAEQELVIPALAR